MKGKEGILIGTGVFVLPHPQEKEEKQNREDNAEEGGEKEDFHCLNPVGVSPPVRRVQVLRGVQPMLRIYGDTLRKSCVNLDEIALGDGGKPAPSEPMISAHAAFAPGKFLQSRRKSDDVSEILLV